MIAFLDFEASSLAKKSYPIEVAWVFEDGTGEAHLIRPAPDWTDWNPAAEAIHRISRERLAREGVPHDRVAQRMVEALTGHELFASAPSWDGKWLSALLRAAGFSRQALRLRNSDDAFRRCAETVLRGTMTADQLARAVESVLTLVELEAPDAIPAHRALADAQALRDRWIAVRDKAMTFVA